MPISVGRSFIRGPRFALRSTDPAKVKACIKCVYGNGEHAEWCERGQLISAIRLQIQNEVARCSIGNWKPSPADIDDILAHVSPKLAETKLEVLRDIFEHNATRQAVERFVRTRGDHA